MKIPTIKAFGYLRVSGKGQLDGDGFPRQRAAIEAHAKRSGVEIAGWFEERAICGKTEWDDRPAWSEMIASLNGTRTIVIERLDRLARDLMVQEHIIADLKRRGIELLSTEEPDLGSEEPSRVLMRQIMGAIAQYDRTMLVRKMAGARQKIRESGRKCEGPKFYGHTPEEMDTLDRMRRIRNMGWSFQSIAEALNANGIKTRSGGRWSAGTVCKILARGGK